LFGSTPAGRDRPSGILNLEGRSRPRKGSGEPSRPVRGRPHLGGRSGTSTPEGVRGELSSVDGGRQAGPCFEVALRGCRAVSGADQGPGAVGAVCRGVLSGVVSCTGRSRGLKRLGRCRKRTSRSRLGRRRVEIKQLRPSRPAKVWRDAKSAGLTQRSNGSSREVDPEVERGPLLVRNLRPAGSRSARAMRQRRKPAVSSGPRRAGRCLSWPPPPSKRPDCRALAAVYSAGGSRLPVDDPEDRLTAGIVRRRDDRPFGRGSLPEPVPGARPAS